MPTAVKERSLKSVLEGLLEQRPIPKGVDFDRCVARMGRVADDPGALCAWMWDQKTGFFASDHPSEAEIDAACDEACDRWRAMDGQARQKIRSMYSKQEASSSSAQTQLLRGKGRRKVESLVSLGEAVVDRKTRSVRCSVIVEGGGNKRDRHWYGPEAIEQIARKINGAKAHVNHPTEAEARSRPEGDVFDLAGFWKDGTIVEVNGRKAVVATLVCDTSEAGEAVLSKAEHAIEYAKQFPGLSEVYAGISINGDGETEERQIDGESWNYVIDVTELPRADVVTRPAREGQFLQLVESIRQQTDPKEARNMAKKGVKEELTKIAEAVTEIDEGKDPKASVGIIEAAVAKVKALFAEAFPPSKEDESEDESEASKKKAAEKKESEDESETEDESEDEAMRADDAGDGEEDPDGDEEAPGDKKAGGKSVVHIKHEEKRTTSEASRVERDLRKQLAEAKAVNLKLAKRLNEHEVKELVESGLPEDFAKSLMDLPAPQRKAMRSLAGMIESNAGGFAGTTIRGTSVKESKPGDGFLKLLDDGGRR